MLDNVKGFNSRVMGLLRSSLGIKDWDIDESGPSAAEEAGEGQVGGRTGGMRRESVSERAGPARQRRGARGRWVGGWVVGIAGGERRATGRGVVVSMASGLDALRAAASVAARHLLPEPHPPSHPAHPHKKSTHTHPTTTPHTGTQEEPAAGEEAEEVEIVEDAKQAKKEDAPAAEAEAERGTGAHEEL